MTDVWSATARNIILQPKGNFFLDAGCLWWIFFSDANDYIIYTTSETIESFHVDPDDQSLIFSPLHQPFPISVTYDLDDNRAYFATVRLTHGHM